MVHQSWNDEYIIKYSQLERTRTIAEIQHPIVRTALELLKLGPNLEICSMADIPAGTGLGSSGSFTTALLKALYSYKKNLLNCSTPQNMQSHLQEAALLIWKEVILLSKAFSKVYYGHFF